MKIISVIILSLMISACQTTPSGGTALTPEGQQALEISVQIAVRHAIADSPRAAEKAARIRAIVVQVQAITTAASTLGALQAAVEVELDKLQLSPLDRADAEDLLKLLSLALEAKLGSGPLQSQGIVQLNEFLAIVLAAIPPT